MLRILFSIYVSFFSTTLRADCDFKQGEMISELQKPANITSIVVTIPKSAKWAKNGFKIAKSVAPNIPVELKKKFQAKFKINYIFGTCEFEGTVKQNGDWRDHIAIKEGRTIQSLNVKINDGNILNSVRFKLLIPETRGGLKEVFGVSVLNSLGFITPETFHVNVSVNGVNSVMLFQETASKELLERNGRREGPIFEGDESLIWDVERLFQAEAISLSRLENTSWFLKGANSQKVTLRASNALQEAYILRGNNPGEMWGYSIDPNLFLPSQSTPTLTFPKFHFVSQALAAEHGLTFHNRKFYFMLS